jgi:hypothetical protein
MWDCEAYLRDLVQSVEPSATQKAAASRSHNYLREVLCTGQFGPRIRDSYLSGSYARDTAISPIDDVDIVIVVDPAGWPCRFWADRPEPERILRSFAVAIRYRYRQSSVYLQRRSVRLRLYHLDIDVVPALETVGDSDVLEIPDADSDVWIKTAPRVHTRIATEVNLARGGRFKPLVKLAKYWNTQLPQASRLKSFAIETIAASVFRHVGIPTLQDGLRLFFDFLSARAGEAVLYRWTQDYGIRLDGWGAQVPDLAGTGSNLVVAADTHRRQRFLEHALRSRDALIRADKARTPEHAIGHIRTALRMV